MQSPLDQQSPSRPYGALESRSPVWDNRFSTQLESFDDNEFEQELTNWFDENKTYDNTQHTSGEDNLDPSLRSNKSLSGKHRGISAAGQQESSPTFMSPQSQERPSDEPASASTTESPNFTRASTSISNKRAIDLDESQQDATTAQDKQFEEELLHGFVAEYRSKFESLNKRLKYHHVELQIKNTDSTIPPEMDNNQLPAHHGGSSQLRDHDMQVHQKHQAPPRLSMSSSPSNIESQAPTIFSQNQQPEDGQSVTSQTTYRSNGTIYAPGKNSCETCAKCLGEFFSTWRNHFWDIHYPQKGWYCLFCKVTPILVDDETLLWKCIKCSETFTNLPTAAIHFTVECLDRKGLFKKINQSDKHFPTCHKTFPKAFVLPFDSGLCQCLLCDGTFQSEDTLDHHCPKIKSWTYKLSTPFPATCECHNQTFDTYDKMNTHIYDVYFKKDKSSSVRGRQRIDNSHDGSQGDTGSNFDGHSQHGNRSQNGRRGQIGGRRGRGGRSVSNVRASGNQRMALGNMGGMTPCTGQNQSTASGSVGNAFLSPERVSQHHHRHLRALKDPTALLGLAQEGQLPESNHHLNTNNIQVQTSNEPPPHFNQPIITDGHPSFIRRTVTPPQP